MALWYFRKHRKFFLVLMMLAVFAMVTWGALAKGPDAWAVIKRWVTGKDPRDPAVLRVYGEDVTYSEWWTTRANLEAGTKLLGFLQALRQMPGDQRLRTWQMARAMGRHLTATTVQGRYAEASRIEDEDIQYETKKRLVSVTAALIHEARRAGVNVTNDMVADHIREWVAAGLTNELMNVLMLNVFDSSPQRLYATLRQEMTLSIYLDAAATGSKALKEDADQAFRRITEKVNIASLVLKAEDFAAKVAEPAEQQVAEQYEKYKGTLPGQNDNVFGYKIPDRVQFKYLVVDADVVKGDVTISDDDIKDYYEENKDSLYVVEKEEDTKKDDETDETKVDQTTDDKKDDDQAKDEATTGEAPAAPKSPDATPGEPASSGEQPAKTLDAPEAAPAEEPAEPVKQEPAAETSSETSETTAEPAKPVDESAGALQLDAKADDGGTGQETPKEVKEYKPLEEVREEIEERLRTARIRELTGQKATDALDRLRRQPRLGLEHVADGKYIKVYQSKGFVTAEEAREAEGIGASYSRSVSRGRWIDFPSLAFSIAPLAKEPEIHLKRPVGVLFGMGGDDQYLFAVTAVEPAHVAGSLDEVREKVVADLKRIAGYALAEKEAQAILDEARDKGLAKVAEAREVEVTDSTLSATSLGRDPLADVVFDAVDAEETLGKLGSDRSEDVTVFEIKDVEHSTEARYLAVRGRLVEQTIQARQEVFKRWFTRPEMVTRRSAMAETDKPIDPRRKKSPPPTPTSDRVR